MSLNEAGPAAADSIDLAEEDIMAAMQEIPGYLDITPRDFKEIYLMAYKMAVARLAREVEAADIMTREVVVVRETTPLAEVAGAMGARGISGVPVVDDRGRVSGVISEKDFLREMGVPAGGNFMTLVANCLSTRGCVAIPIKNQQARDLMTSPPVVIPPELKLREISLLFEAKKVNRAPVVDAEGTLVGIVSRGDLVQAIFQEKNHP